MLPGACEGGCWWFSLASRRALRLRSAFLWGRMTIGVVLSSGDSDSDPSPRRTTSHRRLLVESCLKPSHYPRVVELIKYRTTERRGYAEEAAGATKITTQALCDFHRD